MDLLDHDLGVAVDAVHQHGGEHGGNGRTHEDAEEDHGVHHVEHDLRARPLDQLEERAEQRDDRQARSADGEALGDGLGGVAAASSSS